MENGSIVWAPATHLAEPGGLLALASMSPVLAVAGIWEANRWMEALTLGLCLSFSLTVFLYEYLYVC